MKLKCLKTVAKISERLKRKYIKNRLVIFSDQEDGVYYHFYKNDIDAPAQLISRFFELLAKYMADGTFGDKYRGLSNEECFELLLNKIRKVKKNGVDHTSLETPEEYLSDDED